jgi:hypothetical protein
MNKETRIQSQIMLDLSSAGYMVFRNETKRAWIGKKIHSAHDQVTLQNAIFLLFGLCIGSSDLVGLTPTGRFFAIEVKTATGRASKEQIIFIDRINKQGGIAGIARSSAEALALLASRA